MGNLTLILGGIKTGKTAFAQNEANQYDKRGEKVTYLATAQAFDSEMEDRIERHKQERPGHWHTIEEPLNLTKAVEPIFRDKGVILLDCLTLWLTNLMSQNEDLTRDEIWEKITAELGDLIELIDKGSQDLIIISNQVEYGLVSEHAFARLFQDMAGLTHQFLAQRAHRVYSILAGIPLCLKDQGE